MLLSHRYRFLFVHIAKTGGTSVRAALKPLLWRDPWYYPAWLCHRLDHLCGHRLAAKLPRHAKAICAQEMLPQALFDALFKFAFVRNPWDLQVSSYLHLKRERPALVASCPDLASFLRHKFDPQRLPQYHLDVTATPQGDHVLDQHGRLLVDFVGRYEHLQEDFTAVCRHLGLQPRALPHLREARQRKPYQAYYDDDLAELVAARYRDDIQRFGYGFD